MLGFRALHALESSISFEPADAVSTHDATVAFCADALRVSLVASQTGTGVEALEIVCACRGCAPVLINRCGSVRTIACLLYLAWLTNAWFLLGFVKFEASVAW